MKSVVLCGLTNTSIGQSMFKDVVSLEPAQPTSTVMKLGVELAINIEIFEHNEIKDSNSTLAWFL